VFRICLCLSGPCCDESASAALTQNREVATTGDPVFDGFPSLLIVKMETEEDRLLVHM